jgi:hypothetical protein
VSDRSDRFSVGSPVIADAAAALERYYTAPVTLTLAKLRTLLQSISDLRERGSSDLPNVAQIAKVVRDNGLGSLPLDTINTLVEAVATVAGEDVLSAISLKRLEDILSSISYH